MRKTRKPIALGLAVALVAAVGVGATVAWLTDQTDPVKNTFTVGNIDIDLVETKSDFKMVPGCDIAKDPVVSVADGSEDCWLFVEIVETGGAVTVKEGGADVAKAFDSFIGYSVIEGEGGWTMLEGDEDSSVWYRKVLSRDSDQEFGVLLGNEVTVKPDVTKDMMDALQKAYDAAADEDKDSVLPNLTFKAYAVQLYETNGDEFTAAEAWTLAK